MSPQSHKGFTLIELLIVFSIITILSTLGIAGFVAYSRSASLDTSMKNFKIALITARSRALSQLRDDACFSAGFTGQGYELQGYQIVACCSYGSLCLTQQCNSSSNNYELQAVYANPDGSGRTTQTCSGTKFSDPNISIDTSSRTTATYFFFASVTGAVTTNASSGNLAQIALTSFGNVKIATVSATGVVK